MTPKPDNTPRGIWLMVASMASFAVADMFIKMASSTMSAAHTTLLLMGGGLLVFALLAKLQGAALWERAAVSKIMLIRYGAEMMGSFGIVLALSSVPLSTVGAIIQATPLVVAAGAVVFLKERVSWRRWSAIFVGFLGVLLIVQPGGAGFDANIVWPVVAMIGLAGRDLTTRASPPDMASASLATYTMAAVMPFAALWCALTQETVLPVAPNWGLVAAMVGFGALGYMLLIASVRATQVSVVSPFRYSRLIFLLVLGVVVFGERPDAVMLLGAGIVIASGIYTMWRDRVVKARG